MIEGCNMKLVSLLLVILIFAGCSDSGGKKSKNNDNKPFNVGQKILIIGDSLAAGYGATKYENTPAGCLDQIQNDGVVDKAVPGYTSEEILEVAKAEIKSDFKIIFISSGGNDVFREMYQPNSYPNQKTLGEMQSIFDEALKTGAQVVYLGINPPLQGTERLPQISQLASRMGVVVVDGMKDFWFDSNFMDQDNIHPNDNGYKIMCQRILNSI